MKIKWKHSFRNCYYDLHHSKYSSNGNGLWILIKTICKFFKRHKPSFYNNFYSRMYP